MTAQIAERLMLEPYCVPCKESGPGFTVRREAEAWAARHDYDWHDGPEPEDG